MPTNNPREPAIPTHHLTTTPMSYRDQLQDTDQYGDWANAKDCDPRIYHNEPFDGYSPDTYDGATYLLTSRRFPDGHLVHREYSLPDCTCEVVRLILPSSASLVLAYAMPSELQRV